MKPSLKPKAPRNAVNLPKEIKEKRDELAKEACHFISGTPRDIASTFKGALQMDRNYTNFDRKNFKKGFDSAWALAMEMVIPVLEFYGNCEHDIDSICEDNFGGKARDLLSRLKPEGVNNE